MILPSMLAILAPIVTGMIFGVAGVMGLLTGGLGAGFVLAYSWLTQAALGIMLKNRLKKETWAVKVHRLTKLQLSEILLAIRSKIHRDQA